MLSHNTRGANAGLRNGVKFFSALQTADGHWAGDYGGPMFLLPGYAIVMHITETPIPESSRLEIARYLTNLQTAEGGWGIHIESLPTVFGTALNYVVMRLLGVPRDDPRLERARAWLGPRGGDDCASACDNATTSVLPLCSTCSKCTWLRSTTITSTATTTTIAISTTAATIHISVILMITTTLAAVFTRHISF